MKAKKNLLIEGQKYLEKLAGALYLDDGRDAFIRKIWMAESFEEARSLYLVYHSNPTSIYLGMKAGALLDKIVITQRILERLGIKYPDSPELIQKGVKRRRIK